MKKLIEKQARQARRKLRIRKRISGTAQRPRICIFKSNKHLYAQVVDDQSARTLASVGTLGGEHAGLRAVVEDAGKLGEALGKKLLELNLETAVFDRNGFQYHGVVKAFADGVRKAGIKF